MHCAGLRRSHAQNAVVVVNGDPITNFDIEQRIKLMALSGGGKAPSRQEALEELINDRVKIKEGKKFNIEMSAAEVDAQYATMAVRLRMNADQLNKVLEGRGIRPDTLKARLKADYIWAQLVRGRFSQSLIVGEKDVESAIEVKGDGKEQTDSFEYKMRPVVLFVAKGAEKSAIDLRKKDAETLRGRVQSCEQAESLLPLHARRRHQGSGGEDLGRSARRPARTPGQDAGRPDDAAGGHPRRRRDGRAVQPRTQHRNAGQARGAGKAVCAEVRGAGEEVSEEARRSR